MKLEITIKDEYLKLPEATIPAKPLTFCNVYGETEGAIVSTEKANIIIRSAPNRK